MKNCNKTITFTKVIDYNFNKFFYINFYIENLSPLVDKIEGHGNMHHERIFSLKGAWHSRNTDVQWIHDHSPTHAS